jgi:hypothetical protein
MVQGRCRTLDPVSCDAGRVSAGYLNLLCLLSALLPCLFTSVKESRGKLPTWVKGMDGMFGGSAQGPVTGFWHWFGVGLLGAGCCLMAACMTSWAVQCCEAFFMVAVNAV